ncbi:uncharacterized protein LOC118734474 [Rhagoletis pomonella]|uniref:uncharacterized protein LOC118734474 n=1 Tax=Rhagoletis pomonella TaxID=28610 RepID=UPI001785E82A|nr:uncharacterized protein LOC118734474 [Rhagoletis pomonella]
MPDILQDFFEIQNPIGTSMSTNSSAGASAIANGSRNLNGSGDGDGGGGGAAVGDSGGGGRAISSVNTLSVPGQQEMVHQNGALTEAPAQGYKRKLEHRYVNAPVWVFTNYNHTEYLFDNIKGR